jgi:hypothetical protein
MGKTEKLKPRQFAVIDELFNGDDEQAVLDKYKVSRKLYNKWLADETFTGEFDRRIENAFRRSDILIARYAPLAAAKLVQLTESDKEETARKACLDIISMHVGWTRDDGRPTKDDGRGSPDSVQGFALPDQTASRLLSALAEEKSQH